MSSNVRSARRSTSHIIPVATGIAQSARDMGYFHVVFTVPQEIAAITFQNQAAIYAVLFRAVAETLRELAADPRHLGAEIGFITVLHSWGETLHYRPCIHCIVLGGGLSFDQFPLGSLPCKFLPRRTARLHQR
ncbi:hypothetical protein ACVITL_004742 [Rhizobium pisi]